MILHPKHQDKIRELVKMLSSSIELEAQRLYYSGGVDCISYDPDMYILAKILVTAAARNKANEFCPHHAEHIDSVKNLLSF